MLHTCPTMFTKPATGSKCNQLCFASRRNVYDIVGPQAHGLQWPPGPWAGPMTHGPMGGFAQRPMGRWAYVAQGLSSIGVSCGPFGVKVLVE